MTDRSMAPDGFRTFYVSTLRRLRIEYHTDEFLYPHDPPWPQMSFDYPYGQAPAIDDVPAPEMRDWEAHVASYYTKIALGIGENLSTNAPVEWVEESYERNGIRGYAELDDDKFLALLSEGLYSKFLSELDPTDVTLFGVPPDDGWQYLKADFSCMRVVKTPYEGEHLAPTIAVIRRKKDGPKRYHADGAYQLYKVAVAPQDAKGNYHFDPSHVLAPDASETWRLAKYFVLQGAIHRINLVDHVKVHFPNDTINAMTKSVLPEWHLLHQVLVPHFWLTLPVNDAVLEGDRSLINRDTWYPWSPFVAKGEEIRKLLPFSWGGNEYYYPGEPNQSFPAYAFSTDPRRVPGAGGPVPTFIGLDASLYAKFQLDYYKPILRFAEQVVEQLKPAPTDPAHHDDLVWLEIQHWAYEISRFLPDFPDWRAICDPDTLARVIAVVIWNAAVVHSCDHATLHTMLHEHEQPVPFIMRVFPPWEQGHATPTVGDVLGPAGTKILHDVLTAMVGNHPWIEQVLEKGIEHVSLPESLTPLGSPTDLLYAQMTDLLFYLPHNSSLLYDCKYAFEGNDPPKKDWPARWLLPEEKKEALRRARRRLQDELDAVDKEFFENPTPNPVAKSLGLPRVKPPADTRPGKISQYRVTKCFGAGIQY